MEENISISTTKSAFFKVKFIYNRNREGINRSITDIRIFNVETADELHLKIDNYIEERTTAEYDRWYDMQMIDISRI